MEEQHDPWEFDFFEIVDDSDAYSTAAVVSDADTDPRPVEIECILAEFVGKNEHVWYLVKWKDCPLIQSSWECVVLFRPFPHIFNEWEAEKARQRAGISKPFDLAAFDHAVDLVENFERQKIRLRQFQKAAQDITATITID